MLSAQPEVVPLRTSHDGMIYVGATRVPLETVIYAFNQGATPEEIVLQYSALSLADVYTVIGYYLKHRAEVEVYLAEAARHAETGRQENQTRFNTSDLRERLLARLQKRD